MNRLYGRALATDVNAERHLYPGTTALVLAAAALVPPVTPLAAAALTGALVAADASLGVNGTAFTWLYEQVPGFQAFRVPARFGMLLGLFLTLLAGLGLATNPDPLAWTNDRAAGRGARRRRRVRASSRPPARGHANDGTRGLRRAAGAWPRGTGRPATSPTDDTEYWIDPTYMYYSTFHWARLLNGYSGFSPSWYPRLRVASREFPSDESIGVFRERGAEYFALHEEFYPPGRYRDVVARLEGRTDVSLVGISILAGRGASLVPLAASR